MKKQVRFLSMAVLAAATVFVSCSNDDETVNSNDPVAVKFAATSATGVQTRVSDASWNSGDPVGIYMLDRQGDGTYDFSSDYVNVKYTASSTGTSSGFVAAGAGTEIYYPQSGSKVAFIAYHPFQAGMTNQTYLVDVSDQSNQSAIDLMLSEVADNSGAGYDKTYTGNVNLLFKHRLVKLNLTVQPGAGISNLTGLTVSIKGMNTKANFTFIPTSYSFSWHTPADITPKDAGSYTYEAILLPVTTLDGSHKIVFTIGGDEYTWELSGTGGITGGSLINGTKYDYTVTLEKHGVNAQGAITPWNTATGTGTAD